MIWLNRPDTLFPVHGLGSIASLVQEACDLRGAWLAKQTGVTVPRPWAGQSCIPGSNSSGVLVVICVFDGLGLSLCLVATCTHENYGCDWVW